jgi:hypothetical protein
MSASVGLVQELGPESHHTNTVLQSPQEVTVRHFNDLQSVWLFFVAYPTICLKKSTGFSDQLFVFVEMIV